MSQIRFHGIFVVPSFEEKNIQGYYLIFHLLSNSTEFGFFQGFSICYRKKNLYSNMYSALNYCLGLLIYIGMQCSKYTNQTHTNNHIMTLSASRVILPSTVGMLRCFGFFFFSLFTFHSLTFVYRVLDDLIVGLHLPLSIVKHCWHCI